MCSTASRQSRSVSATSSRAPSPRSCRWAPRSSSAATRCTRSCRAGWRAPSASSRMLTCRRRRAPISSASRNSPGCRSTSSRPGPSARKPSCGATPSIHEEDDALCSGRAARPFGGTCHRPRDLRLRCEGEESWQPEEKLAAALKDKGWQVRRIKVDGGCYEVYGLNEKGERVESYFHPRTLAPVPTGAKNHKG